MATSELPAWAWFARGDDDRPDRADRPYTDRVQTIVDELDDDLDEQLEASVFDDDGTNPAETYRPALVKLIQDTREVVRDLMRGFGSRRELLEWGQRLTVRSLGEVDDELYSGLARQLRPVGPYEERVFLSALLTPAARSRGDVPQRKALELRRGLVAAYLMPASHRAFRRLRKDAGEYLGDARDSEHDPLKQRYIAMRPALDELDDRQADVLALGLEGFDTREEILEWASELENATHGEIPESFGRRAYLESPTAATLLTDSDEAARGREILLAHHVVPAFNEGVRSLAGRAGEQAHQEKQEKRRTTA